MGLDRKEGRGLTAENTDSQRKEEVSAFDQKAFRDGGNKMRYIVLLRGINVSGKSRIAMKELKKALEDNGYLNVITYLNSGNVILDSDREKGYVSDDIVDLLKSRFGLDIPIYVTDPSKLKDILEHAPDWWGTDDKGIYDNLVFIIPPVGFEELYGVVGEPTEKIDRILEYDNVVFWSFDLSNYQKSNWWKKTASTDIKDRITIRTANTMRKVLELCSK